MRLFLRRVKWAWQRVTRGYDDTCMWSFDESLKIFIPPLKELCESDQLDEYATIYSTTLKLITKWEKTQTDYDYHKLWEYVGAHIAWYWY